APTARAGDDQTLTPPADGRAHSYRPPCANCLVAHVAQRSSTMRVPTRLSSFASAIAMLAALAGAPTAALAADGQSAVSDRPVPVVGTMQGQLDSGPRAPFAYYRFDYLGGGRVASINLQVEPDIPTV